MGGNLSRWELHSRLVSRNSQEVTMNVSRVACVLAALALAGCASALAKLNAPKLNYAEYAGEPVRSFYLGNFDGWSAVSKNQLVVWSGMNKAYLLTIQGYCPDLQFAHAIAVTSTGSTVDRFEKVIVGRDRCLIKEIRPLDVKQMKEDRKLMIEQMKEARES
jgi:hypothetical protein